MPQSIPDEKIYNVAIRKSIVSLPGHANSLARLLKKLEEKLVLVMMGLIKQWCPSAPND